MGNNSSRRKSTDGEKENVHKKNQKRKNGEKKSVIKEEASAGLTTTSTYNNNNTINKKYDDDTLIELTNWLKKVGNRLTVYKDVFAEFGFDSLESISTIRKQDLSDLKVKTGHRRIILSAVKSLKEELNAKKLKIEEKMKKGIERANGNRKLKTNKGLNEKYNNNNNINRNKIKLKPLLSTNDKKGSNKEDEQNYTKEFKKVIQFLKLLPGDLSIYSSKFMEYGYDSIDAIMLMKDVDVDAVLPSNKRGHRQVLLHGIVDLNRRRQTSTAPKMNFGKQQQQFNARNEIKRMNVESMLYDVNIENLEENDLLTATSQPRLSPRSRLSRVEKVIVKMTGTPAALRTDLKQVYVLSGRDRLPTHKKRYTGGDSKYSRWDGYAYTAERYNPEIDVWSTIPIDPCFGSGTACGCDDSVIRSIIGYTWSPTSGLNEMPFPSITRSWGDVISGDDAIYAIGGYDGSKGLTNIVEKFDIFNNTWSYISPLPTPRHSLSIARNNIKKCIYAVGGIGGNQNSSPKTLSTVEEYNELSGKWKRIQDLPSARTGMKAIFNQQKNSLFVLGGKSGIKNGVLKTVESFDSRSGKWNRWDDMLYSRTFFGCVVLPSNDILCVGGKKSNEYQTTCEILDIRANKWRIASSMNQIRHAVPHSTAGKVVGRRCRGYTVTLL